MVAVSRPADQEEIKNENKQLARFFLVCLMSAQIIMTELPHLSDFG